MLGAGGRDSETCHFQSAIHTCPYYRHLHQCDAKSEACMQFVMQKSMLAVAGDLAADRKHPHKCEVSAHFTTIGSTRQVPGYCCSEQFKLEAQREMIRRNDINAILWQQRKTNR